MTFWLKKITVIFASLLVCGSLLAQIPPGGGNQGNTNEALRLSGGSIVTAVPFLVISPDSRAAGMGDAGVASSPDINSQHWNAAKYAFIDDNYGVSLTYSPWLRSLVSDMNLLYLAGYYRLDSDWVLASSLRFFSLGKVIFRKDALDPGVTHYPNEYAFDMSLSRKLSEHFSLAVAGRYIRSDLTSGYTDPNSTQKARPANSGAVDVSMFYTRDVKPPTGTEAASFALGLNISNVGAKVSYSDQMDGKDFLPANIRLGGSYTVQLDRYNEITGMIDFNKLLVPTPPDPRDTTKSRISDVGVIQGVFRSFHDAPGGFREEMQETNISGGIEYLYNKVFSIRAGYFFENKHKGGRQYFTVGAGLRFNVFEIDFSYLLPRANTVVGATNPLRNTLRFTLKFNFSEYMRKQNQTP